jgi:hypothetical protein
MRQAGAGQTMHLIRLEKEDLMLLNVSLGDLLWSLIVIFFMVMYFMILFQVIVDVFRRDASGVNKALWLLALLVFPVVSLLAYVIVNGDSMAARRMQDMETARAQTDDYIRTVAGNGTAAEIAQAKALLDSGAITEDEFDQLKGRALAV